jgi:hypothetical protein
MLSVLGDQPMASAKDGVMMLPSGQAVAQEVEDPALFQRSGACTSPQTTYTGERDQHRTADLVMARSGDTGRRPDISLAIEKQGRTSIRPAAS